jgi:hypothetical protein
MSLVFHISGDKPENVITNASWATNLMQCIGDEETGESTQAERIGGAGELAVRTVSTRHPGREEGLRNEVGEVAPQPNLAANICKNLVEHMDSKTISIKRASVLTLGAAVVFAKDMPRVVPENLPT